MEGRQKAILSSDLPIAVEKEGRHLLYGQGADETGIESDFRQIEARALRNAVISERVRTIAKVDYRGRVGSPGIVDDRRIDRSD